METVEGALLVGLSVIAFAAGYALATARARARRPQVTPGGEPPASLARAAADPGDVQADPERVAFAQLPAEGTSEWRLAMLDVGERMRSAGVRFAIFAHGSFVGNDPLAVARAVENAVPFLPDLARALRGFTRTQVSQVLGDLSNFSRDYIDAFAKATGIDAAEFTWSGENHHAARVQAAVRLARALALRGGGALQPGDHVLLLGHSHGGQLFAILSQLVARASGYEELVEAASALGEDIGAMEEHLALLRRCAIDVATFGMPLRYAWARGARVRVLHVVNHRGARLTAPALRGILRTGYGDYIQQLGTHGSDTPAMRARERELNARLDRLLGKGTGMRAWIRHLSRGLRISPHGHTVLVDYGDDTRGLPNFLSTGLGHAAYTRRESMLFHAQLVANRFYPAGAPSPWAERMRGWAAPRKLLFARRRPPATRDG
jgi:hypothetical protein